MNKDKIIKQAQRDAYRTKMAKMDYGEGAGNRRKIIQAEVTKRLGNEIYRKAYNEAMAEEYPDIVGKIKLKKTIEKVLDKAHKTRVTIDRVMRMARKARYIYTKYGRFMQ